MYFLHIKGYVINASKIVAVQADGDKTLLWLEGADNIITVDFTIDELLDAMKKGACYE